MCLHKWDWMSVIRVSRPLFSSCAEEFQTIYLALRLIGLNCWELSRMKRVVLLSVFAIAAVAFWSCRKDVTITPPPSLTGDYEGYYIFQRGVTPPESMCITVRFTQDRLQMRRDTMTCPDKPRIACDADGGYTLSANVELFALNDQSYNPTAQICDISRHPFGTFVIDQSVVGKVTLVSQTGSGETLLYRKFDVDISN